MNGTVKRVIIDKGFGFIRAEDGKEYFFHKTALQDINFVDELVGSKVIFTPDENAPRGARAENVKLED